MLKGIGRPLGGPLLEWRAEVHVTGWGTAGGAWAGLAWAGRWHQCMHPYGEKGLPLLTSVGVEGNKMVSLELCSQNLQEHLEC